MQYDEELKITYMMAGETRPIHAIVKKYKFGWFDQHCMLVLHIVTYGAYTGLRT